MPKATSKKNEAKLKLYLAIQKKNESNTKANNNKVRGISNKP
jgi:hypothetical protein